MNEQTIMLNSTGLVAFGFLLKAVIFGIASGIMIHQNGTSRLANAVKWFFLVLAFQGTIFAILFGLAYYELIDPDTLAFGLFWRNATRVLGVATLFSVDVVGAWFIWVLSRRIRLLIEHEEADRSAEA